MCVCVFDCITCCMVFSLSRTACSSRSKASLRCRSFVSASISDSRKRTCTGKDTALQVLLGMGGGGCGWGGGGGRKNESFLACTCFLQSADRLAYTNSALQTRISPRWLSERSPTVDKRSPDCPADERSPTIDERSPDCPADERFPTVDERFPDCRRAFPDYRRAFPD